MYDHDAKMGWWMVVVVLLQGPVDGRKVFRGRACRACLALKPLPARATPEGSGYIFMCPLGTRATPPIVKT